MAGVVFVDVYQHRQRAAAAVLQQVRLPDGERRVSGGRTPAPHCGAQEQRTHRQSLPGGEFLFLGVSRCFGG